jgi:hypothetical protein
MRGLLQVVLGSTPILYMGEYYFTRVRFITVWLT